MSKSSHETYRTLFARYVTSGTQGLASLIMDGVPLGATAKDGRNLAFDMATKDDADGLRWLSDHGVPVDRADLDGMTPLHLAALHYSTNAAKQLLDLGAAVDPRDKYGNTPLFKAVFESCGRGDMVRLLKANGADVNAVNLHGVTPKSLAYTIANFNVRQFFDE